MFTKSIQFVMVSILISGCSTLSPTVEKADVDANRKMGKEEICQIIDKEERNKGIPKGILNSIAAVESQHTAYAVNARKKAHNFESKEAAAKFIKTSLNQGCKNISVGCLQLHYKAHRRNFVSVNDMLTPENNVSYAAALLKNLYKKHGSWEMAIRMYHTNKSQYNERYYSKVMKRYKSIYKGIANKL